MHKKMARLSSSAVIGCPLQQARVCDCLGGPSWKSTSPLKYEPSGCSTTPRTAPLRSGRKLRAPHEIDESVTVLMFEELKGPFQTGHDHLPKWSQGSSLVIAAIDYPGKAKSETRPSHEKGVIYPSLWGVFPSPAILKTPLSPQLLWPLMGCASPKQPGN